MTIIIDLPRTDLDDSVQSVEVGARPAAAAPSAALEVTSLTRGMDRGDEIAYRMFYQAYSQRLLRYLLVVTAGDEAAAREALQATLIRVVRHIKVFDDETRFWNWLTILARTSLADQRRKQKRYFAFLDRFTHHARAAATPAHNSEADAHLLTLLEGGMHGLAPDERQLIERKYFGDASVRDIASELQLTEKAVESRLVRVRRKLKDQLLAALKHESQD